MRGSPLARALVVFLLMLCAAPGIWQLTRAGAESSSGAPPPAAVKTTKEKIPLELEFTAKPERVSIFHLNKPVWEKSGPGASEWVELDIPWPKEGGDLKFVVDWPAGTPLAAMRVKLTDPERGEIERSLWGRGRKTGVLRFP
jgi:hypothetical protein